MITTTHDTEIAALEDIVEADVSQVALYESIIDLDRAISELEAKKELRRDALRKSMHDAGAQALTIDSKTIARISDVNTPRIDTKRFKAEYPELAKKFLTVTKSVRFTIIKPKEEK
jgi:predicted phage-related endonuclease